MNLSEFEKLPIMGILRDIKIEVIDELIDAIALSGLKTIEIAMNSNSADKLLARAIKAAGSRLFIGAGTVLTVDDLNKAVNLGATFIVLPIFVLEVVERCKNSKIPVFPGAFTPQEVYNAYSNGAAMVKVFPAKLLGPAYIKELKGPFKDIKLLACGGVTEDSIGDFFRAGACAVAFGSSIFKSEELKNKDFKSIKKSIESLIQKYKAI